MLISSHLTLIGHRGLSAAVNAVAIDPTSHLLASASDDKTIRVWDLQTGRSRAVLSGHSQAVRAISFHPGNPPPVNGVRSPILLASGSRDRTIKLWHLQTNPESTNRESAPPEPTNPELATRELATRELATLVGHREAVNSLAFSPDGHILASGSADKTINLWDLATGDLIKSLTGHLLTVNALAYGIHNPCSARPRLVLASASADTTVRVWDGATFELLQILTGHTQVLRAIALDPTGTLVATGGEDKTIRLWDIESGQCLRILSGHSWSVSGLAFSADGTCLISSSWDKTLKLWYLSTATERTEPEVDVLKGHTDSVNGVAIAPNGCAIASGSRDQTIKLWTLANNIL